MNYIAAWGMDWHLFDSKSHKENFFSSISHEFTCIWISNVFGYLFDMVKTEKIFKILRGKMQKIKNFEAGQLHLQKWNIFENYNVERLSKKIFGRFRPFTKKTSALEQKCCFLQHFFSNACIFGRNCNRPKFGVGQISEYA